MKVEVFEKEELFMLIVWDLVLTLILRSDPHVRSLDVAVAWVDAIIVAVDVAKLDRHSYCYIVYLKLYTVLYCTMTVIDSSTFRVKSTIVLELPYTVLTLTFIYRYAHLSSPW